MKLVLWTLLALILQATNLHASNYSKCEMIFHKFGHIGQPLLSESYYDQPAEQHRKILKKYNKKNLYPRFSKVFTITQQGKVEIINNNECITVNCKVYVTNDSKQSVVTYEDDGPTPTQSKKPRKFETTIKYNSIGQIIELESSNGEQALFSYNDEGECLPGRISYSYNKSQLKTAMGGIYADPTICKRIDNLATETKKAFSLIDRCQKTFKEIIEKKNNIREIMRKEHLKNPYQQGKVTDKNDYYNNVDIQGIFNSYNDNAAFDFFEEIKSIKASNTRCREVYGSFLDSITLDKKREINAPEEQNITVK